eukprot:CAMPEP_0115037832 /NCGR_PEP_ID=MMETSP0216-20121206/43047_1 /TAXON_ID=223996 /ORGANISM="Protocruzia adherens, Strain Boccale" /LENGTH=355 /DNA_ID=CAMNT_0002418115 /DNA_START=55 /DNA_END=1123 /DNA_ORIENTATION=-
MGGCNAKVPQEIHDSPLVKQILADQKQLKEKLTRYETLLGEQLPEIENQIQSINTSLKSQEEIREQSISGCLQTIKTLESRITTQQSSLDELQERQNKVMVEKTTFTDVPLSELIETEGVQRKHSDNTSHSVSNSEGISEEEDDTSNHKLSHDSSIREMNKVLILSMSAKKFGLTLDVDDINSERSKVVQPKTPNLGTLPKVSTPKRMEIITEKIEQINMQSGFSFFPGSRGSCEDPISERLDTIGEEENEENSPDGKIGLRRSKTELPKRAGGIRMSLFGSRKKSLPNPVSGKEEGDSHSVTKEGSQTEKELKNCKTRIELLESSLQNMHSMLVPQVEALQIKLQGLSLVADRS